MYPIEFYCMNQPIRISWKGLSDNPSNLNRPLEGCAVGQFSRYRSYYSITTRVGSKSRAYTPFFTYVSQKLCPRAIYLRRLRKITTFHKLPPKLLVNQSLLAPRPNRRKYMNLHHFWPR